MNWLRKLGAWIKGRITPRPATLKINHVDNPVVDAEAAKALGAADAAIDKGVSQAEGAAQSLAANFGDLPKL